MEQILFWLVPVSSVLALGFTACEPEQSGKNLLSTDSIPDSGLRYALLRDCDRNKDGRIDEEEAKEYYATAKYRRQNVKEKRSDSDNRVQRSMLR